MPPPPAAWSLCAIVFASVAAPGFRAMGIHCKKVLHWQLHHTLRRESASFDHVPVPLNPLHQLFYHVYFF
jgi:hypothetical protein